MPPHIIKVQNYSESSCFFISRLDREQYSVISEKMNCDHFLFNVAGLLVAYAYGMFVLKTYVQCIIIIMERPRRLSLITSV